MKQYQKLFVTYELSLRLKALGFNEPCIARYERIDSTNLSTNLSNRIFQPFVLTESQETVSWQICSVPLYQQAIIWLLKTLDLETPLISFKIFDDCSGRWELQTEEMYPFDSLEGAILEGIKLLE